MDKAFNPTRQLVRGLRIVLVLSIIGSSTNMLSELYIGLFYNVMPKMVEAMTNSMSEMMDMSYYETFLEVVMQMPQECHLIMAGLYALSLAGCIMMMCLKQNGWHCYTLAQLLALLVPVLFASKANFDIGSLMMTLLFVAYYFFTLRNIHRFMEPAQEEVEEAVEVEDVEESADDNTDDSEQ